MGHGTRNNGQIKTYWPDDTETEFYIAVYATLDEIISEVNKRWPGVDMKNIRIEAENIHTDCLFYDRYDHSDYTNFLRICR